MNERKLVWIAGAEKEVFHALETMLEENIPHSVTKSCHSPLWIGASSTFPNVNTSFEQISHEHARRRIGSENNTIVYDAFTRFDVDAFAAISGTLIHKGVLYLLTPAISRWPTADTLELERYSVYSAHSPSAKSSLYICWLVDRLEEHTHSIELFNGSQSNHAKLLDQILQKASNDELNSTIRQPIESKVTNIRISETIRCAPQTIEISTEQLKSLSFENNEMMGDSGVETHPNPEQAAVLDRWREDFLLSQTGAEQKESQASEALSPDTMRIVTADRGRGKSTLLGMFCAIAEAEGKHCVITGPSRRAAEILMQHYNKHRERSIVQNGVEARTYSRPTAVFVPPDELLRNKVEADLLFIDEAAALPLPTLQQLTLSYRSIIMATTVHGYEGAGRGFAIRFRDWLHTRNLPSNWIKLETPTRWLPGDSLEHFCNEAFMLNAEYASTEDLEIRIARCKVEYVHANQLLKDTKTLRECFALLVQAHYQTKPMDLRHMLDGQNIRIYLLRQDSLIVGTAMIAIEGFAGSAQLEGLGRAIVEKRRRPKGHLLPQLMAQWTMDESALDMRIARIVRIAIHPELQNRGLGSEFLRSLEMQLSESMQLDATGAVFGGNERITKFWSRAGYQNFHLGRRKNNRSGERSIAIIKPTVESSAHSNRTIDRALLLYSVNFAKSTAVSIPDVPVKTNIASGVDTPNGKVNLPTDSQGQQLAQEIVEAYLNRGRSFDDSRQFIRMFLAERLGNNSSDSAVSMESTIDLESAAGLNDQNKDASSIEEDTLAALEYLLLQQATSADFRFKSAAKDFGFSGKKATETVFKQALVKLF